jgi:hypothetical protein
VGAAFLTTTVTPYGFTYTCFGRVMAGNAKAQRGYSR